MPTVLDPINRLWHRGHNRTVKIGSQYTDWAFWLVNNATNTTFLSVAPAAALPDHVDTTPATSNRIAFYTPDCLRLLIMPFGAGSLGQTMKFRASGWKKATSGIFVSTILFQGNGTLGTLAGLVGEKPSNTGILCSTISKQDGHDASTVTHSAQGSYVDVDHLGCPYITVGFEKGTGTDCNALVGIVG
jgi:hypothetical protein